MCGIAGKLYFDPADRVERPAIEAMLAPIAHRGPDSQGIYLDRNVGLGHARLSIIDVGGGGQPMANEDETVWIVFNGEIYNFQSLREQLLARGHLFRTRTDTEVIIHLYEEHGPGCVRFLRGMFAFAIWDEPRRRLFVARDRVGIKPLYYCQTAEALHFGSELKSIIADPAVSRELSEPGDAPVSVVLLSGRRGHALPVGEEAGTRSLSCRGGRQSDHHEILGFAVYPGSLVEVV